MNFNEIKKFPHCNYHIDVEWVMLEQHIERSEHDDGLNLNPEFQRVHRWTAQQQSKYCEYVLKGGLSGKEIYLNCPGWEGGGKYGPYVLIDGKQRIQAVRKFIGNEIKVFDRYYNDFSGRLRSTTARFSWNVFALDHYDEVLEWYVGFNTGGTPHTSEEIQIVKDMIGTGAK